MKKQYKLGVIGCGFMASAILHGVVLSEYLRAKKILVSDVNTDKLDAMADELGVFVTNDNKYLIDNCEYILFAVKPQTFPQVVKEFEGVCPEKVISIMAGVKRAKIKNALGVGPTKVARCMPNLPCSIGSGMMGIDMSDYNDNTDDIEFIYKLFECLGTVLSIDEDKLDAVTGISGSGPAYVFMFIDSLIDAGVRQGLTRDEAETLAVQTVLGGAEMVQKREKPLSELIMNVCSKGGTTIEAVKVLEENNMRGIVSDAVDACVRRSKELSQ
jgi:pyrroline-5-carboxylate reductase